MIFPTKKCLLTGYPGYLGSRLYHQLRNEYELYSLGLCDAQNKNHTIGDLSRCVPCIFNVKYDLVIHAAGKAHILPKTEAEKESFELINYVGTLNLLKGLEGLAEAPKAFVLISSVSVYGRDVGYQITETASLNALDPYGKSKIKAEQAVSSWDQPGIIKGILRLPLIVGPNPPGNLGKMLKGIRKGTYFNIAGGTAKRSFVWIEDIAPFIIQLASKGGTYNLTDGRDVSFAELYKRLCECMSRRQNLALPKGLAYAFGLVCDVAGRLTRKKIPFDSLTYKKMTSDLTFSCDKAIRDFNWRPTPVLDRIKDLFDE